jgi:hypothetical protein
LHNFENSGTSGAFELAVICVAKSKKEKPNGVLNLQIARNDRRRRAGRAP